MDFLDNYLKIIKGYILDSASFYISKEIRWLWHMARLAVWESFSLLDDLYPLQLWSTMSSESNDVWVLTFSWHVLVSMLLRH